MQSVAVLVCVTVALVAVSEVDSQFFQCQCSLTTFRFEWYE